MKILYLSCLPDELFMSMINSGRIISQAAQKFNKLFVRGFCANGFEVEVVTFCASTEQCEDYCTEEYYADKKITYHYVKITGNVIERVRARSKFVKSFMAKWAKENRDGIAVIDALKPGAMEFSKEAYRNGIKVCSIITDIIDFLGQKKLAIVQKIICTLCRSRFYKQFNYTYGFVLLTESMKEKIQVGNRRYIVIDGICESQAETTALVDSDTYGRTVFLYSGALSKQFGLDNLVWGFLSANIENSELHLYGSGDYVPELKEICKMNSSVKYFGTVPNEIIIQKQCEATFLVNPRPVGDEYTKYSFPSKNIEYMRSGRPMITTKLPCISHEYDPYVFYFKDDTVDGIAETLRECALMKKTDIDGIGRDARQFVLSEKNNVVQTERILKMCGKK